MTSDDYYEYLGDEVGVSLERGRTYRFVNRGIDTVTLETEEHERIELSREVWDTLRSIGAFATADGF